MTEAKFLTQSQIKNGLSDDDDDDDDYDLKLCIHFRFGEAWNALCTGEEGCNQDCKQGETQ